MLAVVDETPDVGLHGRPKVVACEGGEHFGVGDVLEVGVVLASEGFAEGGRNDDSRWEIEILVERESITRE